MLYTVHCTERDYQCNLPYVGVSQFALQRYKQWAVRRRQAVSCTEEASSELYGGGKQSVDCKRLLAFCWTERDQPCAVQSSALEKG